jgi:hypothetical protein
MGDSEITDGGATGMEDNVEVFAEVRGYNFTYGSLLLRIFAS